QPCPRLMKLLVALPKNDRPGPVHDHIGEQCPRHDDGEEVHQADEEVLGVEVHFGAVVTAGGLISVTCHTAHFHSPPCCTNIRVFQKCRLITAPSVLRSVVIFKCTTAHSPRMRTSNSLIARPRSFAFGAASMNSCFFCRTPLAPIMV